jgi:hypothetical protein
VWRWLGFAAAQRARRGSWERGRIPVFHGILTSQLEEPRMIAILRVRFDTNTDANSVWSDDVFKKWMQPLIPFSLGDFWWLSSKALFNLDYTIYAPIVMPDPRLTAPSGNAAQRGALVQGAIDKATALVSPDWDNTDIVMIWYAQITDLFGGGTCTVPLKGGGTKDIRATVVDIGSPFDAACQELGHSFLLNHELDAAGSEYASPYSVMSARKEAGEFLRPPDARLPDGLKIARRDDWYFNQPASRIIGPLLAAAQLYNFPAFRDSPQVIHLSGSYAKSPALVTLYALNYTVRVPPGPLPVLAVFPSNKGDGRLFTVELRRGGLGYDAAIGTPGGPVAGLVVHSINPDGRIRYEGVAALESASTFTDWASEAGNFALRLLNVGPGTEFVQFAVRGGARKRFPIRGVLLAGKFRTQRELNKMSHVDQRNTLIVELTNRSNQSNFQSFDNDTLAGMGAVLVFLREAKIRGDRTLKTMTADDQRNTLIVEIGAMTGLGSALQGLSNMDLVLVGLGSNLATSGIQPGVASFFIRGDLLAGHFRTQHELNRMTHDDQRNTLIVELAAHSNQTNYQQFNDVTLEGMGAVMVTLRGARIRDDNALKTMSADDQRNTLIVEIGAQTGLGAKLQALSNMDLVLAALGVEPV